ncbi:MAG: hypothetical protein K9N35_10765 [Candidatus Marinimicrobia bacterium]|nr:hypothetical protein [Candidatus Neomarinimicrobiota bacterium]
MKPEMKLRFATHLSFTIVLMCSIAVTTLSAEDDGAVYRTEVITGSSLENRTPSSPSTGSVKTFITETGLVPLMPILLDELSNPTLPQNRKKIAINVIQTNQDLMSGYLIEANSEYLLFQDNIDTAIHIIDRAELELLEANTNIDLLAFIKNQDSSKLTDVIEMIDGSRIECIILDMTQGAVQYFTGGGLRRQQVSTDIISMLHFSNGDVDIPFQDLALSSLD